MIFARKVPEFYIIIARKNIFPNFWGEGARPPLSLPPSPTPMATVRKPLLRSTYTPIGPHNWNSRRLVPC